MYKFHSWIICTHHFHMHANAQSLITGRQPIVKKAGLCSLYLGCLWPAEIRGSVSIRRKRNGYWEPALLLPVEGGHQEAMTAN